MEVETFLEVFAVMMDKVFEVLERAGSDVEVIFGPGDEPALAGEDEVRDALRFAALYLTHPHADETSIQTKLVALLDHLLGRVEPMTTPTSSRRPAETRVFFALHWFAVEAAARLAFVRHRQVDSPRELVERYAGTLARRLLEYGFNRTIKAIKSAAEAVQPSSPDQNDVEDETGPDRVSQPPHWIQDYTVEVWTQLIHTLETLDRFLPISHDPVSSPSPTFWSILAATSASSAFAQTGLLAAERIWYLVQGMCAVSQFSPAGRVSTSSSLPAYWPLVMRAVSIVRLESDPVLDPTVPAATLAKRDQYVWTVLGRVHLLSSRWGWRFPLQDSLLGQLGQTIFKSRKFVKLLSDPTADFPLFIRKANKALIETLDPEGDSAFDVFLKVLAIAVRDIQAASKLDGSPSIVRQADRAVSRILAISAPVGKTPFTRLSPPTMRDLSMLVNRYSFTMVAVFLDPTAATSLHSLRQMRSFLSFPEADFKSRKICIRSMMYVAVLHRHFGLDLRSVVDWFGEMTEVLLRELAKLDRPTPVVVGTSLATGVGTVLPLPPKNELIWSLLMILGSIRHIIRTPTLDPNDDQSPSEAYPDPLLLHRCESCRFDRVWVATPQSCHRLTMRLDRLG